MSSWSDWNARSKADWESLTFWEKTWQSTLGLGLLIGLGWAVSHCAGPSDQLQSKVGPAQNINSKIAPDAVSPMDRQNFPLFYQTLGRTRFDEANALAIWAARAAAASESCERVNYVGQSDATTRSRLVWYVDCSNDERFTITEDDARAAKGRLDPQATDTEKLLANRPVARPQSARWEGFDEAVAISQCDHIVSTVAINRGSVDFAWRWDSERNPDTGIVTFQRDFDAQNAMGGTISSRYHCEVNADRGRVTKVMIRELEGWRSLLE